VEGVIETRISHLDRELGQWLELASAEGEAFTAEVVAQALDVEARVVVNRLSHELDRGYRLVRAQGVRQVGNKRLSLYQFRHSLFRQYLYQQLDDIERSYLHQQVGETLEQLYEKRADEIADQLAHHFQMAGLAEKSMIYLVQAGDNAVRVYAYEEAKDFYGQALTLAKQLNQDGLYDEELISLYTKLGRTLEHHADTEGALSVYQEMEELGRSRANQPMILMSLMAQGTLYSIPSPVHDPKQGKAISEQALILAQELSDRAAEARILWSLMIANEYDNQTEKAIEFGERAQILARDLELHRQLAFILGDLGGCYWVVGQIARAKELFREATEIRRKSHNLPMLADVLIQSSFASLFGGDYDEAIALSDEAHEISQSTGNKWNLAFSRSRIGFIHRARGELGQSIEVAEECLRLGKTEDLPNPQIFAGAELAFDYAYLGATDLGLKTARLALNVADEKVPSYRPYLLAALAENHLVNSDFDQAETAIQQARSDPHWQAFPVLCIALILADGRLALARADYDRALQLADELLDQLRRYGIRSYLPEVLDLSGQALSKLGRVEEAQTRLKEARDEAEAMGAKGNLWPILFHLSQLEKEPEEAARLGQEAREIVEFIANNTGKPSFRESFLELPEVQAVIENTE
jgi:tetratricopeptide (TPR) repeat protein